MPIGRLFGYNPDHIVVDGTTLIGDISFQSETGTTIDLTVTGITWYMGPDEDIEGYLIGGPYPSESRPQFWRSKLETDESFLDLLKRNFKMTFSTVGSGLSWLDESGYGVFLNGSGLNPSPPSEDIADAMLFEEGSEFYMIEEDSEDYLQLVELM